MFCPNCGRQIVNDAKFCEYCGAVINTPTISNEKSEQSGVTSKKVSVKKEVNKPLFIAIIIIVIVGILSSIGIVAFDKYVHKKADDEIQAVQDSYFEFLPEMTIGELLNSTHHKLNDSSEMWLYDSDTNTIEFYGYSNDNDICMIIDFTGKIENDAAIISSRKINLDKTGSAEKVDMETFETYILDLYSSYKVTGMSINAEVSETSAITTEKTTIQTTKSTTAEVEQTTVIKTYLSILKEADAEIKSEYGDTGTQYQRYYLYDINHDGIYELFVHINDVIIIYSVDENNELMEIGNINGGNTLLTEKDGKLYSDFGYVGYHLVEEIQMVGWHGVWSVTQETVLEQDGLSDYTIYGTQIKGYDISDTSAVEALCPEELLADSNHITELETPVLKTDCYLSVENESCVEVTWDEIPGADGYYISYMVEYNGDAATITNKETKQSDNVWYEKGSSPIYVYNFSVKAYAESNGNEIYSQWSNSVAVSNSDYVSGD